MNSYQANKTAVGLESTTTEKPKQIKPKPKSPLKFDIILHYSIKSRSINRFEAKKIHDHCLNSKISTLQNNYGICFNRARESFPCLYSLATASVNRYWLSTDIANTNLEEMLLSRLIERRHEVPNQLTTGYKGGGNGS